MDYFKDAFGGFDPRNDRDAAIKFCLDALLADCRIDELAQLISPGQNIGGIEGEPSWIIERRELSETEGYERWPAWACFRAAVDPNAYLLGYSEFFADRKTFLRYVDRIISTYANRHPEHAIRVKTILDLLAREQERE